MRELIHKALALDLEDGLWFGDIQVRELTEQGEYGAYRFDCAFQIGEPEPRKVRNYSRIHIDVGFSDRLPKKPENQTMPSVLKDEEPVSWRVYPVEYIIAEKIQTLFDRGSTNSRAKDVYDLIYLLPRCQQQKILVSAVRNTFQNRSTPLPKSFSKEANQFDQTILAHGWPGVKILEGKPDFRAAWSILMSHFQKLDELMEQI